MSSVLVKWCNEAVGLSRPVGDLDADFSNGFLFLEVLAKHNQLPDGVEFPGAFRDTDRVEHSRRNFNALQPVLTRLGVPFNARSADSLLAKEKGFAANLLYQVRVAIASLEKHAVGRARPDGTKALAQLQLRLSKPAYDAVTTANLDARLRERGGNQKEVTFHERVIKPQEEEYARLVAEREEAARRAEEERAAYVASRTDYVRNNLRATHAEAGRLAATGAANWSVNMGVRREEARLQASIRSRLNAAAHREALAATRAAVAETRLGAEEAEMLAMVHGLPDAAITLRSGGGGGVGYSNNVQEEEEEAAQGGGSGNRSYRDDGIEGGTYGGDDDDDEEGGGGKVSFGGTRMGFAASGSAGPPVADGPTGGRRLRRDEEYEVYKHTVAEAGYAPSARAAADITTRLRHRREVLDESALLRRRRREAVTAAAEYDRSATLSFSQCLAVMAAALQPAHQEAPLIGAAIAVLRAEREYALRRADHDAAVEEGRLADAAEALRRQQLAWDALQSVHRAAVAVAADAFAKAEASAAAATAAAADTAAAAEAAAAAGFAGLLSLVRSLTRGVLEEPADELAAAHEASAPVAAVSPVPAAPASPTLTALAEPQDPRPSLALSASMSNTIASSSTGLGLAMTGGTIMTLTSTLGDLSGLAEGAASARSSSGGGLDGDQLISPITPSGTLDSARLLAVARSDAVLGAIAASGSSALDTPSPKLAADLAGLQARLAAQLSAAGSTPAPAITAAILDTGRALLRALLQPPVAWEDAVPADSAAPHAPPFGRMPLAGLEGEEVAAASSLALLSDAAPAAGVAALQGQLDTASTTAFLTGAGAWAAPLDAERDLPCLVAPGPSKETADVAALGKGLLPPTISGVSPQSAVQALAALETALGRLLGLDKDTESTAPAAGLKAFAPGLLQSKEEALAASAKAAAEAAAAAAEAEAAAKGGKKPPAGAAAPAKARPVTPAKGGKEAAATPASPSPAEPAAPSGPSPFVAPDARDAGAVAAALDMAAAAPAVVSLSERRKAEALLAAVSEPLSPEDAPALELPVVTPSSVPAAPAPAADRPKSAVGKGAAKAADAAPAAPAKPPAPLPLIRAAVVSQAPAVAFALGCDPSLGSEVLGLATRNLTTFAHRLGGEGSDAQGANNAWYPLTHAAPRVRLADAFPTRLAVVGPDHTGALATAQGLAAARGLAVVHPLALLERAVAAAAAQEHTETAVAAAVAAASYAAPLSAPLQNALVQAGTAADSPYAASLVQRLVDVGQQVLASAGVSASEPAATNLGCPFPAAAHLAACVRALQGSDVAPGVPFLAVDWARVSDQSWTDALTLGVELLAYSAKEGLAGWVSVGVPSCASQAAALELGDLGGGWSSERAWGALGADEAARTAASAAFAPAVTAEEVEAALAALRTEEAALMNGGKDGGRAVPPAAASVTDVDALVAPVAGPVLSSLATVAGALTAPVARDRDGALLESATPAPADGAVLATVPVNHVYARVGTRTPSVFTGVLCLSAGEDVSAPVPSFSRGLGWWVDLPALTNPSAKLCKAGTIPVIPAASAAEEGGVVAAVDAVAAGGAGASSALPPRVIESHLPAVPARAAAAERLDAQLGKHDLPIAWRPETLSAVPAFHAASLSPPKTWSSVTALGSVVAALDAGVRPGLDGGALAVVPSFPADASEAEAALAAPPVTILRNGADQPLVFLVSRARFVQCSELLEAAAAGQGAAARAAVQQQLSGLRSFLGPTAAVAWADVSVRHPEGDGYAPLDDVVARAAAASDAAMQARQAADAARASAAAEAVAVLSRVHAWGCERARVSAALRAGAGAAALSVFEASSMLEAVTGTEGDISESKEGEDASESKEGGEVEEAAPTSHPAAALPLPVPVSALAAKPVIAGGAGLLAVPASLSVPLGSDATVAPLLLADASTGKLLPPAAADAAVTAAVTEEATAAPLAGPAGHTLEIEAAGPHGTAVSRLRALATQLSSLVEARVSTLLEGAPAPEDGSLATPAALAAGTALAIPRSIPLLHPAALLSHWLSLRAAYVASMRGAVRTARALEAGAVARCGVVRQRLQAALVARGFDEMTAMLEHYRRHHNDVGLGLAVVHKSAIPGAGEGGHNGETYPLAALDAASVRNEDAVKAELHLRLAEAKCRLLDAVAARRAEAVNAARAAVATAAAAAPEPDAKERDWVERTQRATAGVYAGWVQAEVTKLSSSSWLLLQYYALLAGGSGADIAGSASAAVLAEAEVGMKNAAGEVLAKGESYKAQLAAAAAAAAEPAGKGGKKEAAKPAPAVAGKKGAEAAPAAPTVSPAEAALSAALAALQPVLHAYSLTNAAAGSALDAAADGVDVPAVLVALRALGAVGCAVPGEPATPPPTPVVMLSEAEQFAALAIEAAVGIEDDGSGSRPSSASPTGKGAPAAGKAADPKAKAPAPAPAPAAAKAKSPAGKGTAASRPGSAVPPVEAPAPAPAPAPPAAPATPAERLYSALGPLLEAAVNTGAVAASVTAFAEALGVFQARERMRRVAADEACFKAAVRAVREEEKKAAEAAAAADEEAAKAAAAAAAAAAAPAKGGAAAKKPAAAPASRAGSAAKGGPAPATPAPEEAAAPEPAPPSAVSQLPPPRPLVDILSAALAAPVAPASAALFLDESLIVALRWEARQLLKRVFTLVRHAALQGLRVHALAAATLARAETDAVNVAVSEEAVVAAFEAHVAPAIEAGRTLPYPLGILDTRHEVTYGGGVSPVPVPMLVLNTSVAAPAPPALPQLAAAPDADAWAAAGEMEGVDVEALTDFDLTAVLAATLPASVGPRIAVLLADTAAHYSGGASTLGPLPCSLVAGTLGLVVSAEALPAVWAAAATASGGARLVSWLSQWAVEGEGGDEAAVDAPIDWPSMCRALNVAV